MADRTLTFAEFRKLPHEERLKRYAELSNHDKFLARCSQDTGVRTLLCSLCDHYRGFAKCDAFPDGISGEHMDKVEVEPAFECAPGIRFEAKPKQ